MLSLLGGYAFSVLLIEMRFAVLLSQIRFSSFSTLSVFAIRALCTVHVYVHDMAGVVEPTLVSSSCGNSDVSHIFSH